MINGFYLQDLLNKARLLSNIAKYSKIRKSKMNYQPPVYLTPHLYMTNEEVAIVDGLVDHQEMPKKFDSNRVITYFEGQDFCLVLFFADLKDRGFQKYVVSDFSVNVEEMCMLSNSLTQMISEGINVHLLSQAKNRVDNMIHMSGTFRALFGKKKAEETDDW
ncbi:hypothetical protein DR864_25135 [Runella rosea]|uniref:Uncharacterized protein n=1 Tax=Runella rosea TaxID=2259595 RepID=A0A344TQ59_9BACT|nr:hypothetical protein [Runella rosea]AXE20780.1 hypothetical protein DR864_25135 [Runella rosea]